MEQRLDEGWGRAGRLYLLHGPTMLGIARWITGARTLVPRLAGMSDLSWRRYLAAAVPSALLWTATLTGAGYAAGASYARVVGHLRWGSGALAVLVLVVIGSAAIGHPLRPSRKAAT